MVFQQLNIDSKPLTGRAGCFKLLLLKTHRWYAATLLPSILCSIQKSSQVKGENYTDTTDTHNLFHIHIRNIFWLNSGGPQRFWLSRKSEISETDIFLIHLLALFSKDCSENEAQEKCKFSTPCSTNKASNRSHWAPVHFVSTCKWLRVHCLKLNSTSVLLWDLENWCIFLIIVCREDNHKHV